MVKGTVIISDNAFRDANRAIEEFNKDRQAAIGATGYAFTETPGISPIQRSEVRIDPPSEQESTKAENSANANVVGKWKVEAKFGAIRTRELFANGKGVDTTEDGFRFPTIWKIVDGQLLIGQDGQYPTWRAYAAQGDKWVGVDKFADGKTPDWGVLSRSGR
jgi:hypothetical protein